MTGRDNHFTHFNQFCAENLVSIVFLCILMKEDKPVVVFTLILVHHILLFTIETKAAFKKGAQFGDSK